MRSEAEVNRAIDQYADLVQRLCMIHLKNRHDTEDIFQNVFLKFLLHSEPFDTEEHEKAWVIRVTLNECRDLLKSFFRRKTVPMEEAPELRAPDSSMGNPILEAVLALPPKYRDVIYMHYYEGYSGAEMGEVLHKNTNTVYTLLNRGRELLRESLGGEELE